MPVKRRPISKRAPIASDRSRPKTTRPVAKERRPPEEAQSAAERMGRTLDAMPDRIDIRDWFYQPSLTRCQTSSSTATRYLRFSIRATKAPAPATHWPPSSTFCCARATSSVP